MELSSPQIISSQEESHCRNLPQEIIVEILLKLPVKSLLRFRCVSKSWFSLTSSGDFIIAHLKTSTKDSKYAHHGLLLHSNYSSRKFCSCSLYSILHENAPVYTELHLPLLDQYPQITIVGSCNGLFCIFERVQCVLILWNPSTRKYSKLSNSNTELHSFSYSTYGFGYDVSHDDYKVVVLFCFRGAQFNFETKVISIYSLKTKSWRSTQINTSHTVASESAVFFNGVLHWGVANHGYARRSSFIVTFDLTKETFREIPLPNSLQDVNMGSRIGILGDCLSMVYHYYEVHADIWVMNDYGVKESWTKLLTIQYNTGFVAYVSPIIVIEDGELLLMLGTSMMLYSPRDNTFKHCEIQSPGGPNCVGAEAVAYIESLVSPDS